ncbi:MAG: hypothetical protein ABI663_05430 [Chryseolinea sp.]
MATTKKHTLSKAKNNPSKKTQNENAQFPGYPQYSADDDIFRKGKRIDENLDDSDDVLKNGDAKVSSRLKNSSTKKNSEVKGSKKNNESDVTKEDLQALGPKDLSMDMGDDEELKQRQRPVDFAGKNLDVPGSDADDAQEDIGSEDEENNVYSQAD